MSLVDLGGSAVTFEAAKYDGTAPRGTRSHCAPLCSSTVFSVWRTM
jgi:hypothetical protein